MSEHPPGLPSGAPTGIRPTGMDSPGMGPSGMESTEIARGHLRDPRDRSFAMYRYEPALSCRHWLRVYWIPVWTVPEGEVREQRILSYPVCLLSITASYARLVGPCTAAARTQLSGSGWAFGAMLMPAAGRALLQADVGQLVDAHRDLADVPLLAGLVQEIRGIMAAAPSSPSAHRAAAAVLERGFSVLGIPSRDALAANRLVARVEEDRAITTVRALAGAAGMNERTLQRLCARHLGVSPRWIIRQRRLQEAAAQLRAGGPLSGLAAELGYADQAHFSRDFRAATGWTPGTFASLVR